MANIDFHNWLNTEMQYRNMRQKDLAERGGISQAQVSRVISGDWMPGPEFCRAVAKALKLPPQEVFRVAGLLPPDNGIDGQLEEIAYLYKLIEDPENKRRVVEYIEFLIQLEEKKERGKKDVRAAAVKET